MILKLAKTGELMEKYFQKLVRIILVHQASGG